MNKKVKNILDVIFFGLGLVAVVVLLFGIVWNLLDLI